GGGIRPPAAEGRGRPGCSRVGAPGGCRRRQGRGERDRMMARFVRGLWAGRTRRGGGPRRGGALVALLLLVALLVTACGGGGGATPDGAGAGGPGAGSSPAAAGEGQAS